VKYDIQSLGSIYTLVGTIGKSTRRSVRCCTGHGSQWTIRLHTKTSTVV